MKNAEMRLFVLCWVLLAGRNDWAYADLGLVKSAEPDPALVEDEPIYYIDYIALTNLTNSSDPPIILLYTDVIPAGPFFAARQLGQGTYTNSAGTILAGLDDLHLQVGVTDAVIIVINSSTLEWVDTDTAGAATDNSAEVRSSAVSTIIPANWSPDIQLPGPHIMMIGGTTSFVVTVTDPDHDPVVTVTNTIKPEGAVFDGTNFSWTATRVFWSTTNVLEFVADDHQGEANSVVTQRTTVIVARDGDHDDMDDGWEWDFFGTLARDGSEDADGDGLNDYEEFIAGTQPTNTESVVRVLGVITPVGSSNRAVRVLTEPGRKYTIYWRDSLTGGAWEPFASSNAGVIWETGSSSTIRVFVDDEGTNTTQSAPVNGCRFYRVRVSLN